MNSKMTLKMKKSHLLCPRSLEARGRERSIIQESSQCVKCYKSRLIPVPWESRGHMDGQRRGGHSGGRDAEWRETVRKGQVGEE